MASIAPALPIAGEYPELPAEMTSPGRRSFGGDDIVNRSKGTAEIPESDSLSGLVPGNDLHNSESFTKTLLG